MSTGLELIPLALAVGALTGGARRANARRPRGGLTASETVEARALLTRFRDEALVLEALGDGAVQRDGTLHGMIDGEAIALVADDDGTYVAYFHGELSGEDAQAALMKLDGVYGALVQRDVRDRVIAQAPAHDMALERETVEADGTVVMTLRTSRMRLRPNGTVEAVTRGLKGDECLPHIEVLERVTDARTVDSHYTDEYYEGREQLRVQSPPEQVDIGGR